jgi:hypothetical protein
MASAEAGHVQAHGISLALVSRIGVDDLRDNIILPASVVVRADAGRTICASQV